MYLYTKKYYGLTSMQIQDAHLIFECQINFRNYSKVGLLIISFIEGEQLTYSNLSKMSITKTQVLGELHFKFM